MNIRETSDAGTPVVVAEPEGEQAKAYRDIALKVLERLKAETAQASAPTIVFE
jgi:ATP-binding protein involved in chromosome partitioning